MSLGSLPKIRLKKLKNGLLEKGLITESAFNRIIKNYRIEAKQNKVSLLESLAEEVEEGKRDQLLPVFCGYYRLSSVWLGDKTIAETTLRLIPKEAAGELSAVVFDKDQEAVYVATSKPENKQIKAIIKKTTGCRARLFLASPKDIALALSKYDADCLIRPQASPGPGKAAAKKRPAKVRDEDVSAIKLVNDIIKQGLLSGASDIHIEPARNAVIIRYRIDGILRKADTLPKALLPSIIARIKIITNIKIDEHMVPQDGRFRYKHVDREVAIRVSIIPTLNGPKAVMRLLDAAKQLLSLDKLGFNQAHLKILEQEINSPQGMILVTGPTGSGKTTTLYTVLSLLNKEGVNICTIEDPIEYDLENINQMQANVRAGLDFAQGLRSLMRQDPNIIMVGEIRDPETGRIAMSAAMTGHLVLSTLHTNNAFLAPQRMIEMNVEPYLVASVTNLIIGQRLVRRLCPDCRVKCEDNDQILYEYDKKFALKPSLVKLKKAGLIGQNVRSKDLELYRPGGCPQCGHTGYRGRIGIYEIIAFNNELKKLVLKDSSESAIRAASEDQTVTMSEDGILKTISGITTFDEVMRVTRE